MASGNEILDVNDRSIVDMTDKLEQMHKSAFPSAARETLNSAVFYMKGAKGKEGVATKYAQKRMEQRDKRFWKVISRARKAKGFDMAKMEAVFGFTDDKLRGQNNYSVEDLEEQEGGGVIQGRDFIPLATARTGKNWGKKVKKRFRISDINNVVDSSKNPSGDSPQEKYILSALHAGKGGWVLGNIVNSQGNRYLMFINSIKEREDGVKVNSTPIYVYRESRKLRVRGKGFIQDAVKATGQQLNRFFLENANRQIQRLKRQGKA